jgi:hypothetical protein
MLRRLTLGLLFLLPGALGAQEGTVAFQHSVKLDFELPDELRARMEARGGGGGFPSERVSQVVLLFNGSESLMKQVPGDAAQGRRPGAMDRPPGGMDRRAGMIVRMRMSSASRRDRETLVEAHVRYGEGTIVEAREFLGRTFLIEDQRPEYAWRLTGEQAEFLGYVVQKATAVQDSTRIEAWFTPEILVPAGPGTYGGLPGMILVVSVDDGREQYSATAVSLTAVAEGVIVRPTEGETVSRERYEEIVAEKLEELRTVGGGP